MNLMQAKELLKLVRESNCGYTPLLVGPAGIGKTESVRQFAKENGYPLRTIQLGQMSDAGDLIGLQYIKGDHAKFTIPEWFPTEENTVLFFDEINRASKDLQQAVFQIISKDKEYNGRKLPKGCFVVGAINPPSEEYDVIDLGDEAWRDRFCYVKIEPSATEWVEYARGAGVDERMTAFIKNHPEHLGIGENKFRMEEFVKPTPRANEAASLLLNMLDTHPKHIVQEAVSGIIGPIPAMSLFKFIATAYTSIDVKVVLKTYSKVRKQVQDAVGAADGRFDMVAKLNSDLLTMLDKRRPKDTELVQLRDYVIDLPKDMAVALLRSMVAKKNFMEHLVETKSGCKEFFGDESIESCAIAKHFGPLTPEDVKKAEALQAKPAEEK